MRRRTVAARILRFVVLLLLLAPLVVVSLPAHVQSLRWTFALAGLPPEQRREALLGSWVRATEDVARTLPPRARVDLVAIDAADLELAPFVAAALFPHPVWCFEGWENWQRRAPAVFIRDARGVNAAAGAPPRSDAVVIIDRKVEPPVRIVRKER